MHPPVGALRESRSGGITKSEWTGNGPGKDISLPFVRGLNFIFDIRETKRKARSAAQKISPTQWGRHPFSLGGRGGGVYIFGYLRKMYPPSSKYGRHENKYRCTAKIPVFCKKISVVAKNTPSAVVNLDPTCPPKIPFFVGDPGRRTLIFWRGPRFCRRGGIF